jgi:hypothetical protein
MSTGTICLNCEDFIDELRQRPRQFIYAIVAEPDAFVLYKAYTNNGTPFGSPSSKPWPGRPRLHPQ